MTPDPCGGAGTPSQRPKIAHHSDLLPGIPLRSTSVETPIRVLTRTQTMDLHGTGERVKSAPSNFNLAWNQSRPGDRNSHAEDLGNPKRSPTVPKIPEAGTSVYDAPPSTEVQLLSWHIPQAGIDPVVLSAIGHLYFLKRPPKRPNDSSNFTIHTPTEWTMNRVNTMINDLKEDTKIGVLRKRRSRKRPWRCYRENQSGSTCHRKHSEGAHR